MSDLRPSLAQAIEQIARQDFIGAKETLEKVLKNNPGDTEAVHQLGLIYARMGNAAEAAKRLREAWHHDKDNAALVSNLGAVLMRLDKLDDAIELMADGVSKHPANGDLWTNYGSALGRLKRFDEAFVALEKARQLAPENPVAYNLSSRFYNETGNDEAARDVGRQGLRVKDELAQEAFNRLTKTTHLSLRQPQGRREKNVVSFSLFGEKRIYTKGAIENAQLARRSMPDWECRIYHDETVPSDVIKNLASEGANCVLITGKRRQLSGPFWRFFVNDDPMVDRFICRDADCRLNSRDIAAVEDWVASGKDFHLMRDHPWHSDLILAGLWGGRAGILPNLEQLAMSLFSGQGDKWDDQVFLGNYIWPLIRSRCLIHDSQFHLFGSRDFPEGSELKPPDHVGYTIRYTESVHKFTLNVGGAEVEKG